MIRASWILKVCYMVALTQTIFVCIPAALSQTTSSYGNVPSSLAWYAALAKSHGQSSLTLGTFEGHDYAPSLVTTAKRSVFIKGQVIQRALDQSDGFNIFQWYRIRVMSRRSNNPVIAKSIHSTKPSALGVPQPDEIVLKVPGGTINIDGVAITKLGPKPLDVGARLALFLEPSDDGLYAFALGTSPILLDGSDNIRTPEVDFSSTFRKQLKGFHRFDELDSFVSRNKQVTYTHY